MNAGSLTLLFFKSSVAIVNNSKLLDPFKGNRIEACVSRGITRLSLKP